jgi:DNA-binding transcriptional regulator PaaX
MKKSYIDKATYTEKIISHLLSCRSMSVRYAVLKELINEREKNEINKFKQSLYRLKTKGFIKISDDKILLNHHKYMQENMTSLFFQKEERVEGVMVMFDIPEEKKKIRDWLRRHLQIWGFVMIQKSVWFGKGKITEDFKNHLKLLDIKDNVKIFNATQLKI